MDQATLNTFAIGTPVRFKIAMKDMHTNWRIGKITSHAWGHACTEDVGGEPKDLSVTHIALLSEDTKANKIGLVENEAQPTACVNKSALSRVNTRRALLYVRNMLNAMGLTRSDMTPKELDEASEDIRKILGEALKVDPADIRMEKTDGNYVFVLPEDMDQYVYSNTAPCGAD